MGKSTLQEKLAALYLRLNGYFVSGFIVHAPIEYQNAAGETRRVKTVTAILRRIYHNDLKLFTVSSSISAPNFQFAMDGWD